MKRLKISGEDHIFDDIQQKRFDDVYDSDKFNPDIKKFIHSSITDGYKTFAPHVSGFYYIHMVHGTWWDHYKSVGSLSVSGSQDDLFGEFSKYSNKMYYSIKKNFGKMATDIDIPQINIEYESISGKQRTLNYANRMHYASDFSISYVESYENEVIRYHEMWIKYIDALRQGYLPNINGSNGNKRFEPGKTDKEFSVDIPYFNAVWIAIYKPFSTKISGLIKILGVSPINFPIKQVIGDRGKNQLTTINQNYKSNDMVFKFFDTEKEAMDSEFYQEFIEDVQASMN